MSWPGLIAMAAVLAVAMVLVAWAAFTLGDPPGSRPRRPLPAHQLHPRHAVEDQVREPFRARLVPGYVASHHLAGRRPE